MCLFYLTSHKNRIGTRKEPEEGIKKKKKVKASASFARYLSKSPKTLSKKCNFTNWAVKKEKNSFLIDKNLMQELFFCQVKVLWTVRNRLDTKIWRRSFWSKIFMYPLFWSDKIVNLNFSPRSFLSMVIVVIFPT